LRESSIIASVYCFEIVFIAYAAIKRQQLHVTGKLCRATTRRIATSVPSLTGPQGRILELRSVGESVPTSLELLDRILTQQRSAENKTQALSGE